MGTARRGPLRGARTHSDPQPYRCFLVRCRLEAGAGSPGEANGSSAAAWRFTVQQADVDATRRSFASLEAVATYLEAELAATAAFADVEPEDDFSTPDTNPTRARESQIRKESKHVSP